MKVALVGNQNSGKTTLFNLLTGSNQKIGNWPGVTLERKSGTIRGTDIELVDLPGIYSMSPYTCEEDVSRHFVFEEKPDLIINIIDATSIERSLYLTTQLLELDQNVVIALNMVDIMEKSGVFIDVEQLSKELETSIVKISALKKTGVADLIKTIKVGKYLKNQHKKIYPSDLEESLAKIMASINSVHKRFVSVKLLESDPLFKEHHSTLVEEEITKLNQTYGTDMEEIIANARYEYIVNIKENTVRIEDIGMSITDKLDKIFLNKWLALPIFAFIMFLVYYLAVGVVGKWTVDFVENGIALFGAWVGGLLETANASKWLISLIVDGIIAGVGAVLNFVPQLTILFLCISLLETSGYMSRIAFFLDRIFKRFGLSGKSLIPFIVGTGCTVPGVMATRTIESDEERRMSIMLTPFIPCSAKLPIMALFAGFFFKQYAGLISASLYFLAIFVILISAIVMKKFFFKGQPAAFISELPNYKLPSLQYVVRDIWDKVFSFIKKAGSIILLSSVVIWFLLSFSWRFQYGVAVEDSILASIGNLLSWIFYPIIGELSWEATVSAIQGLVAKEQVVSSMAIIAGLASDVESGELIFGPNSPFAFFTGASAYAFIIFNLFSAPCFGAIGAMKRELGSTKKMWIAVLFQTGLAWVLASCFFILASLIGAIAI